MASNLTNQSRNVLSKKIMTKSEESLDDINLFSVTTIMSFLLLSPVTILIEGIKFTPAYMHFAGLNIRQVFVRSFLAGVCFHAYQQCRVLLRRCLGCDLRLLRKEYPSISRQVIASSVNYCDSAGLHLKRLKCRTDWTSVEEKLLDSAIAQRSFAPLRL